MDGPTGYNVRFQSYPGFAFVTLRISPSTILSARFVADALFEQGVNRLEIWRSGELVDMIVGQR